MANKIDLSSIQVDAPTIDNQPVASSDQLNNYTISPDDIVQQNNPIQKEEGVHLDPIDRRRQILLLNFYINEFPEKLRPFCRTNFESLSDEKLIELKNEFDFIIGCRSNVKMMQQGFVQGVRVLEYICVNYTPMNVNGLSNMVNDSELQDDLKHLALKHMSLYKSEPEHRILYKLITSMLLLHQVNSSNIALGIAQQNKQTIQSDNIEQINTNFKDI